MSLITSSDHPVVTVYGGKIDLLNVMPSDIEIMDIAHSLAHQCRYAGHCNRHYSVAEHSLFVSRLVPAEFALEALMHDAAETYTGDIIKPVKHLIRSIFEPIETAIEQAIALKFGLVYPWPNCVIEADKAAYLIECVELRSVVPRDMRKLNRLTATEAAHLFHLRFCELTSARTRRARSTSPLERQFPNGNSNQETENSGH